MPSKDLTEIWFPITKDQDGYPKTRDWEGLFCAPQDDDEYEVRSVPFYVKDVAYGDTIKAIPSPEGFLRFDHVRKRGGHSVYRIYLHQNDGEADAIAKELREMNSRVERDGDLIAIAVPSDQQDRVVDFILKGRELGRWGAQDGYVQE